MANDLADLLAHQMKAVKLPKPEREFTPFSDRKFRIDLAYIAKKIAIEVDGAEWVSGRHSRGAGMASDNVKLNRLTAEGWKVYRFTGSQVKRGEAIQFLEQVIR